MLQGRVVIVNFWTYTCINWQRTQPYVRAWAQKYKDEGLVVVGVHTPEFEFEKNVDNIRPALAMFRVEYPVAVDSGFMIWNAFNNRYWPACTSPMPAAISGITTSARANTSAPGGSSRRCSTTPAASEVRRRPAPVEAQGIEIPADWDNLQSPETYIGYERGDRFASPGGVAYDERHLYQLPVDLRRNEWALAGNWTIGRETALVTRGRRARRVPLLRP